MTFTRKHIEKSLPWALLALHVVFLWPVIIGQKVFFLRDIFHYYLPLKWQVVEAFRHVELPLWDASNFLGKSLIGDPSAGVFDPANFLYVIFPFHQAFQMFFVLHLLIFAFGMYLLIRQLGGSVWGAFLGAFSVSFSPAFQFMTTHYSYFGAYCFVPLFVVTFLRFFRKPTPFHALLMSMVVVLQLLKSEPQTVYLEGLFGMFAIALAMKKCDRSAERWALFGNGMLATVAILCMGACQWWPSVKFLGESVRSSGLSTEAILSGSLPPQRLLEYLWPYPFGNPLSRWLFDPVHTVPRGDLGPWALSYHLGIPILFGAFFLFPLRRNLQKIEVRWAFGVWMLFVMLSLGKNLYFLNRLFLHVPGWNLFRNPEKFMIFANIALGTALGLMWGQPTEERRTRWMIFFGAQILLMAVLHFDAPLIRSSEFFEKPPVLVGLLPKEIKGRFYTYRGDLGPKGDPGRRHFRTRTEDEWNGLKENVGTLYGISYLAGYSSAVSASFVEIWKNIQHDPGAHFRLYNTRFLLGSPATFDADPKKITLGTDDLNWTFKEDVGALPRSFVVESRQRPVIREGRLEKGSRLASEIAFAFRQTNHRRTGTIDVPSDGGFWLLWSENFDGFWRASRNGEPVTVETIYPGIRALPLLGGHNAIDLTYEIPYLKTSLAVSLLGFLSCFVYLLLQVRNIWKR